MALPFLIILIIIVIITIIIIIVIIIIIIMVSPLTDLCHAGFEVARLQRPLAHSEHLSSSHIAVSQLVCSTSSPATSVPSHATWMKHPVTH
jgi:hypothetical protein